MSKPLIGGRVRAVLFDLDGTLIDTVTLILSSFRYATRAVLGAPLPDEILMCNIGVPLARQMQDISPDHADELLRVYREHNAAMHDSMIAEYPGTREALEELREMRLPMGVVTSKGSLMARRGLEAFGLGRFFETVVTADDVALHKPDPHPLIEAAGHIGVPVERCLYLGDSPYDITAALAAGSVSVAALWGAFPPEAVLAARPEYALETIIELPSLLDGEADRYRAASHTEESRDERQDNRGDG